MDFMTVQEVAEVLRVRRDTVRKLLATGKLPGAKVGRDWRVPRASFETQLGGTGMRAGGTPAVASEAPAKGGRRMRPVIR